MKRHKHTRSADYMKQFCARHSVLLLKCVYLKKTNKRHIKEATLLNTPTSWNISILWFFFKAERCSYGGRNPYQHWLDRLITLEAILSLLVMGHQITCTQNKKRSKAYCYQTVKEQDRAVASTSDKKNCWEEGKEDRKCPSWAEITQNNTEVLSFFLLYRSKVRVAGTFHFQSIRNIFCILSSELLDVLNVYPTWN